VIEDGNGKEDGAQGSEGPGSEEARNPQGREGNQARSEEGPGSEEVGEEVARYATRLDAIRLVTIFVRYCTQKEKS